MQDFDSIRIGNGHSTEHVYSRVVKHDETIDWCFPLVLFREHEAAKFQDYGLTPSAMANQCAHSCLSRGKRQGKKFNAQFKRKRRA